MKIANQSFYSSLIYIIILSLGLISCKKNDSDQVVVGEAKVKMVNAIQAGNNEDVFVDGKKITATTLSFGETTDYLKITSGSRNISFTDGNNVSTIAEVSFTPSITYTAFLVSDKAGVREVIKYEDNLSNSETGKIKIKVINLTPYFNTGINVSLQAGVQFINGLQFKDASSYFNVDPGVNLRFNVVGSGSIKTIESTNLTIGKIYTIWFSGFTAATLEAHLITDN